MGVEWKHQAREGSTVGNRPTGAYDEPLDQELHIQSILDMPCGDFNWMKELDL